MEIDKAGGYRHASRVNQSGSGDVAKMPNGGDSPILDCDVAREPGIAGTVEDPPISYQDVIGRALGEQNQTAGAQRDQADGK